MTRQIFQEKVEVNPRIYAYSVSYYPGLLKVGQTKTDVLNRVDQQFPIKQPKGTPYTIELDESAMRSDGTSFTDHDVHSLLENSGFVREDGEWFNCKVEDIRSAILALRERRDLSFKRNLSFKMRPEQEEAVNKTIDYFNSIRREDKDRIPRFLWNAKMRFGKTFASYQLAKRMNWTKVLVLTFKPAVENAWEEDLASHLDFEGWQFISKNTISKNKADRSRPIVCFGSFQDFLGKNKAGGIKLKNEWVHEINWDCVIFDEYHYGAWRENAQELFEAEDTKEKEFGLGTANEYFEEDNMPITTDHYLYLSGTPFRAIATGEFIEEQIFNWTYTDEQKAKEEWKGDNNPYLSLPEMVMFTYELPPDIRDIAQEGEFDEFDLNTFFAADGKKNNAKFVHQEEVQKWLSMIRGAHLPMTKEALKQGAQKPILPFLNTKLLQALSHTFWFLPSVASCYAMYNLLQKPQNKYYHDYEVIVAAGKSAGIGVQALEPVRKAMKNPLETKTITLSCGKLTTGVTVKPWTGIFMLRNTSSPETYFQAAFRVQSPWTIKNPDGLSPNKEEIMKKVSYIFDFAPNRALRLISEYSCRLNVNSVSPEQKVADFISFLPILAYDGASMKPIDAKGVLDMAMSGTTATLLARRWESALLVNVDNMTLEKLLNNDEAMKALMSIEGFRNLNQDIETIINKSESIKKTKKEASERDLNPDEKKQLNEEQREYNKKRKEVQEKLIKFATRIPIFMYLTDYREETLIDVIRNIESDLFRKVTGLTVKDFDLLVSLNVFNRELMNDAVYKFKRYENSSLAYSGLNKHEGEKIGLYDTIAPRFHEIKEELAQEAEEWEGI